MSLTPSNSTVSHHPAWATIAKLANDDIERLLEHFFSSTDNLLYDLSKRASNNVEAAFYFDAMRELRLVRHHAIEQFCAQLTRQAHLLSTGTPPKELQYGELDLCSNDELDRKLACETVINNVDNLYHDELRLLVRRLTQLTPLSPLKSELLPISPTWLAHNFMGVIPGLSGRIVVILFKQLEKHLLRQIGPLLSQCNEYLIKEGFLNDAPSYKQRLPLQKLKDIQTSLDEPSLPAISSALNFALPLHSLRQILANARFQAANDAVLNYRYAFNPGPTLPLPLLNTALTEQQLKQADLSHFPPKNLVGDYVSRALQGNEPKTPNALNPYHEDIIQLVAAFFDELLEDTELTTVTQSLLCRLQIPVLKTALHNESFFSNAAHPARKIINLLTEVAQSIESADNANNDPIYDKLLNTVKRINTLYELNDDIFSSELETLNDINEQETKRAEIIEVRTRQAEEGRQRFERAKSAAQDCITHYTGDLKLRYSTQRFINEHWQQVLVLTFLKEGQSSGWLTFGQTLNDLLWLDQEHSDERSRQRANNIRHSIDERLMAGLSLLHLTTEQCQTLSTQVLEGCLQTTENEPTARISSALSSSAIERQREKYATLKQHYFEVAKNMRVGTWVNYQFDGDTLNLKLSNNTNTESFLFVNRLGLKKCLRSRQEFALDLQSGKAKVLNQEPLFDRLMSRALGHLKNSKVVDSIE
ncbi:MAG: DUF1631 family protein [Marinagarivorans sp.]|nr:DUF1631 family protein [Marinagarivorans sp.]